MSLGARHAELAERDGGWECWYCDAPLIHDGIGLEYHEPSGGWLRIEGYEAPHADHVIPRSDGGTDDIDNLVLSCAPCNIAKGTKTLEEFLL